MQEEAMLNLKWDSFSSHLTNSLDVCYEKQFFVDLSLVCKNGTILKCHKMIVANASSFFRRLLVGNDHSHPMIILHDIEADDLKTIINFMYCGEIQVVKSEVERILKVAEILEVSGLKDIRSKILAPETNYTSHESLGTSSNTESMPKIVDSKSLAKTNMEAEASSRTSSFGRRLPIAKKSFRDFFEQNNESERGIEALAKSQANLTKDYENTGQEIQVRTSGRITADYQRAINIRSDSPCGSEIFSKKRLHREEPITWTKVLSEIFKETSPPLKRLCVMDEVEITTSKPRCDSSLSEGLTDYSATSRTSPAIDPLDTSGVYIKEEVDIDIDDDDDYDSNVMTMERDDNAKQQTATSSPSLEAFGTANCTSGIKNLTPKAVTLMEVLGGKDSRR